MVSSGGVGSFEEYRQLERSTVGQEAAASRERSVKFEIRQAKAREVYLFAPLFDALFREEGQPASEDALASIVAQSAIDVEAGLSALYGAVAALTGHSPLVGCIMLSVASDPLIGWHYVLGRLYVHPACRNRGLAGRLVRAALGGATDPDRQVLITTRGKLPRSYRRLGARPLVLTSSARLGDVQARLGLGGGP
jgi:GNAT superfamily N-acetyltransferase